jgi:transcriptional regulator of acetoin/glycerol metabolism
LTEDDLGLVLDEKETIIASQKEAETAELIAEKEPTTPANNDVPIETSGESNSSSKIATLKEIEMEAIKSSVERNKWNMTTTAEELGISRMTLYRKLEQYGLRGKE